MSIREAPDAEAAMSETPQTVTTLECPCCGCEGAVSDEAGLFHDQQPLICGCPGWVCADGEEEPWISLGDG